MRLPWFQNYSRLEHHSPENEAKQEISSYMNAGSRQLKRRLLILQIEVAILVGICIFLMFQINRRDSMKLVSPPKSDLLLAPAGQVQQIWQYQKIYSQEPNEESEAAWRDIFPKGRGFVHHESLAPNISNIAVFHELHCLASTISDCARLAKRLQHGIRTAYYDAISGKVTQSASTTGQGSDPPVDVLNTQEHIHHVRHCFDYLRQALMCGADSNLEEINWKLGGTTGWGVKRQCRDFDAVVEWAERHRLDSQTNIS